MFDNQTNRKKTLTQVYMLEQMAEIRKQVQRPSRIERYRRILQNKDVKAIIRGVKRRLKRYLKVESDKNKNFSNPVPENDLRLDNPDTASRKDLYFSKEKIAVYTVLFGAYDDIQSPLIHPDNIDYFIITDQNTPTGDWHSLSIDNLLPGDILHDPVLCNRWCKMHPHLLFPEYSMSIYVDANLLINSDLTPMTAALSHFPVSMFRHADRNCVYDEVTACIQRGLISAQDGMKQELLLREHGIPKHWGLLEAPVIARRHHDPLCISIMEEWWQIFSNEPAKRDQIALIDCLWKMNIPPEKIGVLGSSIHRCPMLIKYQHRSAKK